MENKARLVTWILVIGILLCVYGGAYAEEKEEFTIHNGTKFGMTPEEVIACEKAAGFELKENTNSRNYGLWGKGTIAGQKNAKVFYTFIDNKLIQADYRFPSDESFNTIEKALTDKYGETDHSYITGEAFEEKDIGAHANLFSSGYSRWTQRIVVSDELVVAIDHHVTEILVPEDTLVYTALSVGDVEILNEDAMNDL